jgi:hypothetical protein
MPALHIMTFNIQLLPWLASVILGQTNDAEDRANRVADDIFALPASTRPDVIVFNEVFDEDGREILLTRLAGTWPHVIKKMHDGGVEEDSGLMLFSRIAFLPLSTGGVLFERFYGDSAGDDAHASKGVGVVRLDTSPMPTTIAFTHLQASYTIEDDYRDVRVKQLDSIHEVLDQILGGSDGAWGTAILLGDLNVRGDSGATSNEWAALFEQSGTRLCGPMLDGWRAYMHPPGMTHDVDPGFTNIDYASGKLQRLDYQCFVKDRFFNRSLVPHHMFVRLKNQSDHFALEAIVQQPSPNCVPSEAIDFLSLNPMSGGQPGAPSSVRFTRVEFAHQGSYQWLFVKKPGTYSINVSTNVTLRVYAQEDLSHPLERLDTLVAQQLPPGLHNAYRQVEVSPTGQTFVSRTPFFIALRSRSGATEAGLVTLLEHRGESAATAIALPAHRKVASSFPVGQKLGNDDICWFKAIMPQTFTGAPRLERFVVENPGGREIKIAVRDSSEKEISKLAGAEGRLELTYNTTGPDTPGAEFAYLTIERDDDQLAGFRAIWLSPISYLLLDEPMGLYVDEESGPDWSGADEPEMQILVDNDLFHLFSGSWDDADSGERWPNLDNAIRQRAQVRLPGAKKMGFVNSVSISYVEPDMNAQGWLSAEVAALSPSEPEIATRRISMSVPDVVSDGHYTFYCTISKIP